MTADDSNISALKEARQAFRAYIEKEKDPVKQEKLKEFLPYMEKTFFLRELEWFRAKAIQTADATRAFMDSQKEKDALEKTYKIQWIKRLVFLWLFFLVMSPIVIWTGLEEAYVYTSREGSELVFESYQGKTVFAGKEHIPLEFCRTKKVLRHQPLARYIGVVAALLILALLTFSRVVS